MPKVAIALPDHISRSFEQENYAGCVLTTAVAARVEVRRRHQQPPSLRLSCNLISEILSLNTMVYSFSCFVEDYLWSL